MTTPAFHISEEEAETIMAGPHGTYTGDDHRWHTDRYYVFERDGRLFEFLYMEPATEMQDGQDVWEADPIPCYEVWLGYRMVIEYRRIKPDPEEVGTDAH